MLKSHFVKNFFLVACLFFVSQAVKSQDILNAKNLSQIKVDQVPDSEIKKFKTQLATSGMTLDQAEPIAMSKGMPAAEFAKLRVRLSQLEKGVGSTNGIRSMEDDKTPVKGRATTDTSRTDKFSEESAKTLINPLIFGSQLFTSNSPNFEADLKLATPVNYILGPEDVLEVSVYGVQEFTGEQEVSPEGTINVTNVGVIKVSGMTIEAATQKIRAAMIGSVYPTLKSGTSKLSVSLGKIRTIRVTVLGAVRPNNYNLSSLATVFNALYVAGGPSEFGSFRRIELLRNNQVIRTIDLYKMLLTGNQSDNVGLKDNDVIRIPAYKTRVEIQGQVKRPGIFEVLPSETFSDILEFASGFTDTAYRASVKVFQRTERENQLEDLESTAYNTYKPKSGDVFVASKILNRYQNRVKIAGAVFRPDVYSLTKGLRVADLIRKADGLKEDAFTGRAQIFRLQEDLSNSVLAFDVRKALAGDTAENKLLLREDEVVISSVLELKDTFKITIQGEVRFPGEYFYLNNLTLKDLILQAGGFTDAAFKNIEIARMIKRDSLSLTDNRASSIIHAEIDGDLTSASANLPLSPYDVITIRRKAGYTLPESVIVSGQVQYPGPYALSSRNEHVSDILQRAGGYTPDAYPEGAFLKRFRTPEEVARIVAEQNIIKNLQKSIKDTSTSLAAEDEMTKRFDQIPLDLPAILKNPGSVEDLVVRSKDELVIPKFDGQVKVTGSVLMVTQVPYQKNNTLKDYISEAGGFSADAWRKKAYVVYANGKAATTRHFLFFKSYPKVLPGSKLVVPKKPEKKGASVSELIAISTGFATLAGLVIALMRL